MIDLKDLTAPEMIRYALNFLAANLDPDEVAIMLKHDMETPGVVTDGMIADLTERLESMAAGHDTSEYDESDRQIIRLARIQYAEKSDDNVEIDDDPIISRGNEGAFVSAWVFVRYPDADSADEPTEVLTSGLCDTCGEAIEPHRPGMTMTCGDDVHLDRECRDPHNQSCSLCPIGEGDEVDD